MAYFDAKKDTVFTVDASPVGLSGILSLRFTCDADGQVVAYAIRALSGVERWCSQTEKEARSTVWAIEHRFSSGAIGSLLGAMKAWENMSANMHGLNQGRPKSRSMMRKQRGSYGKSNRTHRKYFFIMTLLLSGDISLNPGPVKNPCSICLRPVTRNHKAVSCDACKVEVHIHCEGITKKECNNLAKLDEFPLTCRRCCSTSLPLFNINNGMIEYQIGNLNHSNDVDMPAFEEVDFHQIKEKSGLKMLHLNINGVLSELDYVRLLAEKVGFDILSLNETTIDAEIGDEDIHINGYSVFRNDRSRHGGGVLLYVKESIEAYQVKEWEEDGIEAVSAKVCLKNSSPLIAYSLYRPPNNGQDVEDMEAVYNYLARVKNKLKEMKEVHIFGDLNCNMLKSNALSSLVKDTCNITGGAQLIKSPTRVTATSSSLIDIFICTAEHFIKDCGIIKTAISDHYMLYAIRKGKKFRCPPRIIETRSFKKFDDNKFNEDLEAMDLTGMYTSKNIDDAATIFTEKLLSVADKHAPKVTIRLKNRINNIFSDEFIGT